MERPAHVLTVPRWTSVIYGLQILLAIIILGLDAYGIHWIPYDALIFSLVAALVTMLVSGYILLTSLSLHNLYNMYVVLALHILMIIFWIVDMGLVANLARIWAGPECSYSYYYGYYCTYGKKRSLPLSFDKRDTTTFSAYYRALAAGAFFGSCQFVLWVLTTVLTIIHLNKHRSGQVPSASNPPAYVEHGHAGQGVPLESKFAHNVQTQPQPQQNPYQQQPQQVYSAVSTPQHQPAQPVYGQQQQSPYNTYPQDPINRGQTISPVTQQHTGYSNTGTVSELSTPQHTGAPYNPNVSELSTK
ncbi:hypothetical protein K491DRAFT_712849 [Lophiostoma macrostomum CBS 122681]|uniref:MARVEL domain-containing protein n=1 Tax=Lophiostoma macrostomum CBS 122681 TaxID=1314788 RepID=A0A6A6THF0_9PLEO|nr:hypothetical protein K491DRAFT_712849 [Lophiostoma macrostomum CBS 122681]